MSVAVPELVNNGFALRLNTGEYLQPFPCFSRDVEEAADTCFSRASVTAVPFA